MNNKKNMLQTCESRGRNRFLKCILCVASAFCLCGCSLAVPAAGEEGGGDRMIGGLITTEFLDLLSAAEDTDPGIHSAYEGKLYAEIDKSKGDDPVYWEISFGDLEGIQMLTPLWTMENGDPYWGSVCTEGITDPDIRYNESDDSEEHSISGTVYIRSGKGNETAVYYANPVYQTADGRIYVTRGHGVSASGESPEGMEMSTTLSGEITTMVNGRTKTEKSSVSIRYAFMDQPVRITVCQMDQEHQVIKKKDYRPEDMPEELTAEAGTDYILVETEKKGLSGEKTVSREVYGYSADEEMYLTSFCAREDGILVRQETKVL